ncbi:MAG TPA: VWA domain-containing protein [Thermoanaerobaculia bacterium]|nr:VWA domain-containing protein [Thermoanaerobaculia bacterium]
MRRTPPQARRISLAALLTLLAPLAPALAQQAADQRFGEQVTVSEVLLDVVVTDKQGNVIIGLAPDDFLVEEDGKTRDVASATFYSNRRLLGSTQPVETSGGSIDTTPRSRYFILFFEDQRRTAADNPALHLLQRQPEAVREAKEWVREEVLLDDYVAVVSYDVKLKVHQDFTQDRGGVLKAIDGFAKGEDPGSNWPSRLPEAGEISLRTGLPRGKELDKQTGKPYDAFRLLAQATSGIVGRKNLIYFGLGFGELTGFGLYKPDPRYYPGMIQALNDNNVAVYTIDLIPSEVSSYPLEESLHQLADETGGKYFGTFASFETPLGQISTENSGYYLLSYQAEHPAGTTGYQKVRVKTRNPEFQVRTREGYVFGG